ncbi:hypothetical protein Taro_049276 [Colocasia esculenta]|uniref:Uncharacterized protein n=1 Tax=Colocasia esculenta TaxID=4460 RepID=A0A843XAG8_COLES|nr:hypothetical protein [Colocasia esculenta]
MSSSLLVASVWVNLDLVGPIPGSDVPTIPSLDLKDISVPCTKVWRIPDSDRIGFFLIRSDSGGSNRFSSIRLDSARTLIEGIRAHRGEPRIGSSLIRCDSGGSARLDPARQTMPCTVICFKVIYGQERGETAVLLLSPERSTSQISSPADLVSNRRQFTFFLTCPLLAFCQLAGLSDIDQDSYDNAEIILSMVLAQWEVILCTSVSLNQVYAQVLSDPFLRRLILRFIFCRASLSLYHLPDKGSQYLPDCLPDLPDSVSPSSSSIQSSIMQLADSLGVASHFNFFDSTGSSILRKQ